MAHDASATRGALAAGLTFGCTVRRIVRMGTVFSNSPGAVAPEWQPQPPKGERMGNLLWLIIIILVIMWLGGFALHIGGGLIHLLLVIAVIVLIFQLITGRRAV